MTREQDSREAILDFYAEFFVSRLNQPASVGRIAAALMLSSEPLSQADLRQTLGLSEGSVSEGLRLLVEHGDVERAGDPRARPAYFQIRAESWAWPLEATLDNTLMTHQNGLRLLAHYEEFGVDGPARELVERSAAMYEVLVAELPGLLARAKAAGERVQPTRSRRRKTG